MSKAARDSRVDSFIAAAGRWRDALAELRRIALDSGLAETLKWGKPCYTFRGKNLVLLQDFKDSCAMLFPGGALLEDPGGRLEKPGPNSQSGRRIRFTAADEVAALEPAIQRFTRAAIEAEKAGKRVPLKKISEHAMPEELRARLDADPELLAAFRALTPGRQRAYFLHISAAKRAATRAARVERCAPRILAGKGLNDR